MSHSFDRLNDAAAAGYDRPGHAGRVLETYQGYKITIADTSGPNSFGYDFGVRAIPDEELLRAGHRALGPFGETVTVWGSQEKNQLGRPGAFLPMFAPGTLDTAILAAKAAIDTALA